MSNDSHTKALIAIIILIVKVIILFGAIIALGYYFNKEGDEWKDKYKETIGLKAPN